MSGIGNGAAAGKLAVKALLALAVAAAPAQEQRPCLSTSEAEALATVALPDIIRQTGVTCAGQLPPASLLRQTASPMLQRYDMEADRAWPAARVAIVKLSGPAAETLLSSQFARPMLMTLVTPLIVGRIAVKDCGTIDRLITLLEPLPARNTAGVIVTALQIAQAAKSPVGGSNPAATLPFCQAGTR